MFSNQRNKYFVTLLFCGAAELFGAFCFLFCKQESSYNKSSRTFADTVFKSDSISKKVELLKDTVKKSFEQMDLHEAIKLHYESTVIDSHNDYLYQVFKRGANFGMRDNFTQSGLPRFKEGGVDIQVFAVWIPSSEEKRAYAFAREQINRCKRIEEKYSDEFEIAYNTADIDRILKSDKMCGLLGIEDGIAIGNDVDNIDKLFQLGIRYIGLTWNRSNLIGTSGRDESERGKKTEIFGGLTKFGFDVVKRMDEIGMMIDVSHLGEGAFWDVVKTTKNPIIASHSGCYSLNPHYRNLTDEQIKAIAESGGVIMVNFLDDFINENGKSTRTQGINRLFGEEIDELYESNKDDMIKFNEERYKLISSKKYNAGTSVDDLIDHIDYIKKLVGVDYIGLGSDFDGGITPPVEIYDATCYPIITIKLAERGYTAEEIQKILGKNFLRVFRKVCG